MMLSPSTVRHHVSEILSKLDASNRAEAAVIAMKHGIIKKK
jgi:DNA-binding NarL/FixJ family response regulator